MSNAVSPGVNIPHSVSRNECDRAILAASNPSGVPWDSCWFRPCSIGDAHAFMFAYISRVSSAKSRTDPQHVRHGRVPPGQPERTKSVLLKRRWLLALAVVVAAVLVYVPSRNAGWTDTDDIQLIAEDLHFLMNGSPAAAFGRSFFPSATGSKQYYRPLVTLSFMVDARRAGGAHPGEFHSTNVLLHVLSSLLVLAIAWHRPKSTGAGTAAALIFAVHPAAVQTVAWVPGRSDGLMAVFALGAILAWLEYDRTAARRALLIHWVLLAASLLSKETAIALVPLVFGYSVFVTRRAVRVRALEPWLGWCLIAVGWLMLRALGTGARSAIVEPSTVLGNLPMLLAALGKLMLLVDLQVLATLKDTQWLPGWVAVVALAFAACWLSPRRRRPFLWAALAMPILTLAPTLAVADVLILDNRLYLAAAGLGLGLAVLVEEVLSRSPALRVPLAGLFALTAILLGSATMRYARGFESPKSFCLAAVTGAPHLPLAHLNLGSALFREGDYDAAAQRFSEAIALDPRWPVAHNNLGLVHLTRGRWLSAEQEFVKELEVNPDYPKAHFNLGLVLANTGRLEQARRHFERVVERVPTDVSAWGELLKYWAPRDARKAAEIMQAMQRLGVRFHSPRSAGQ